MSPRQLVRVIMLATLAAVNAACGGNAEATPAASTAASAAPALETTSPEAGEPTPGTALNACEIVTADDIKAATKVASVTAGTLKATPTSLSPGGTECRYEGDFGGIIVALTPEDGANLYDAARGAYKDAVDITGLGDGAFTSDQNDRAFIWKGAVTVMLTTFLSGELDKVVVSKDLGERIISKL
jgi:hypothetical protein